MTEFFCAICDDPIEPEDPDSPVWDDDGVYHIQCFNKRDEERRNAPDPAWD